MNTVTEPSLTVKVSVSAPERQPVVVRFDSESDELPLPEAVKRIAALVADHPRVILTTSVAGRHMIDEFVCPEILRQAAPQPTTIEEPITLPVVVASTQKSVIVETPQKYRIHKNPVGKRLLVAAAIIACAGIVGAGSVGFISQYWQPQTVESVQQSTPWASPTLLSESTEADFTIPGWSAKVSPKATLLSTELGVVVTGDKTFRVINSQGWLSKKLKLAENPKFLAVVSVDGERRIAIVDADHLRLWSPQNANTFTTLELPPTARVTAAGGLILIRTDTDMWTVQANQLVPIASPESGHTVALTTNGLVTVNPPAQIIVTDAAGENQSTKLSGFTTVTRWLGVNESFAAVIWESKEDHVLAIHRLKDGQLATAITISGELAKNGRWIHDASNTTATFGHLLIGIDSGEILVKSDPAEPFTSLVHGAAHSSEEGAGVWLTVDGKQVRVPDGHEPLGVYENSVITRAGKKVYEWKANE